MQGLLSAGSMEDRGGERGRWEGRGLRGASLGTSQISQRYQ